MSDPDRPHGTIYVNNCAPDCPCQRVHIVDCDTGGEVDHHVSLDPRDARSFANDLLKAADIAEAQKLKNSGGLS